MKYAIVEHGGTQYLAKEGGSIEVDRMSLEVGKAVTFKDVLLVADGKKVEVGAPFVAGASVKGKVLAHPKGKKVTVFKYRPKQRYRRTRGHRQQLTHVSIEKIGQAAKPATKKAEKPGPTKKKAKSPATSTKKASSTATKKSGSTSAKKPSAPKKKQG